MNTPSFGKLSLCNAFLLGVAMTYLSGFFIGLGEQFEAKDNQFKSCIEQELAQHDIINY